MRKTEGVKSIFGRALEIGPAAERSAYLDQACGADAGLRAEVDGLLAALQKAGADERRRGRVRFWLGRALAGQKRYAEAEPLLLGWHDRLRQWEKGFVPGFVRPDVPEAMRSLAALYDAWGKPDRAKEWRRKLEEFEKQQDGE